MNEDSTVANSIEVLGTTIKELNDENLPGYLSAKIETATLRCKDASGNQKLVEAINFYSEPKSGKSGSIVFPVDIRTGEAYLVARYRQPIGKVIIEFPRGFADPTDSSSTNTALRECQEEVGITSTNLCQPVVDNNFAAAVRLTGIFKLGESYTDSSRQTDR